MVQIVSKLLQKNKLAKGESGDEKLLRMEILDDGIIGIARASAGQECSPLTGTGSARVNVGPTGM